MLIDRDVAMGLVGKMSWMPFFPADNADYVEILVHALRECAQDEAHATRIVTHIQFHDERSPMPSRIMDVAVMTVDQPQAFKPRRRLPDEMQFVGRGMYSVWTEADLGRHQKMLTDGRFKHTRECAKQLLAGWDRYCQEQGYVAFAEPHTPGNMQHHHPDARCHECNDTYWRYVSGNVEGFSNFTGTVERCGCAPKDLEERNV